MLPKRRRLTAAEVKTVMAQGRGGRGTVLSAKVLASKEPFRCAVVVSKKVAKGAVMRNRLRRAVYRALSSGPLPPTGYAILFVLAAPGNNLTEAFNLDIKKLLHV